MAPVKTPLVKVNDAYEKKMLMDKIECKVLQNDLPKSKKGKVPNQLAYGNKGNIRILICT